MSPHVRWISLAGHPRVSTRVPRHWIYFDGFGLGPRVALVWAPTVALVWAPEWLWFGPQSGCSLFVATEWLRFVSGVWGYGVSIQENMPQTARLIVIY